MNHGFNSASYIFFKRFHLKIKLFVTSFIKTVKIWISPWGNPFKPFTLSVYNDIRHIHVHNLYGYKHANKAIPNSLRIFWLLPSSFSSSPSLFHFFPQSFLTVTLFCHNMLLFFQFNFIYSIYFTSHCIFLALSYWFLWRTTIYKYFFFWSLHTVHKVLTKSNFFILILCCLVLPDFT